MEQTPDYALASILERLAAYADERGLDGRLLHIAAAVHFAWWSGAEAATLEQKARGLLDNLAGHSQL